MTFAPVAVNVLQLKINSIDNSALLNIGPNQHVDFFMSYKRNQGIGEQNGDLSPVLLTLSTVLDQDLIDSQAIKNSII